MVGHSFDSAAADEGRVVARRLNRLEYQNTICDLPGVKIDFQEMLPPDSSEDGFDNVGAALHTSSFLMDRYLEAASIALDRAIANLPQPPAMQKRYSLKETHQVKSTTEDVFRKSEDDNRVVMFSSSPWQSPTLSPFYPPEPGTYRFRILRRFCHRTCIRTDSTRLITMLLLGTSQVPPIPGVSLGHHDLSHHGQDRQKIA